MNSFFFDTIKSLKTILSQYFGYLAETWAERITHFILNLIVKYITHPSIKGVKNLNLCNLGSSFHILSTTSDVDYFEVLKRVLQQVLQQKLLSRDSFASIF